MLRGVRSSGVDRVRSLAKEVGREYLQGVHSRKNDGPRKYNVKHFFLSLLYALYQHNIDTGGNS